MRLATVVLIASGVAHGFRTADDPPQGAQLQCSALLAEIAAMGETQRSQVSGLRATEEGTIVSRGDRPATPDGPGDEYHDSTHVVLTLPRWSVLTVAELRTGVLAHFMQAPGFLEHLDKQRLRTSGLFVFALFVLYQTHAHGKEHAEPVWQAWLGCHRARRTGEDAMVQHSIA
jgi:hypothetical protein